MRLSKYSQATIITDHDLLNSVATDDHHPPATTMKIALNGSFWAPGYHEYKQSLPYAGYKSVRAIVRGPFTVSVQGHDGAIVEGSDTPSESCGISMRPYGAGYVTSYIGAYSRLHGDSHISHINFGSGIVLTDIYIKNSTQELVWGFTNTNALLFSQLKVWGLAVVK